MWNLRAVIIAVLLIMSSFIFPSGFDDSEYDSESLWIEVYKTGGIS